MSTIKVQLPDSLYQSLLNLAAQNGVSVEQFVATAVAEKVAVLTTESYLQERAQRGDRSQYEAALAKVPDVGPDVYDRSNVT